MKRNDMLAELALKIDKHFVNIQHLIPENLSGYIAVDVLDAVEEAGMLPPMYIAWPDVECCELNEWEYEND